MQPHASIQVDDTPAGRFPGPNANIPTSFGHVPSGVRCRRAGAASQRRTSRITKSICVAMLLMLGCGGVVGASSGSATAAPSGHTPVLAVPATSTLYAGESADSIAFLDGGIGVFDPNHLAAGAVTELPPVPSPVAVA